MTESGAINKDAVIWSEAEDDYFSPTIFVTDEGAIGINVGGYCFVKPVREWHLLAAEKENIPLSIHEAST